MSSGRRRSSRLINSPWVYNWTKKKLEYISIDDDSYSCRPPGIVSGGTLLRKKVSGSVFGKPQGKVSTPLPRLDIRNERMDADRVRPSIPDEEDDEFLTPQERFDSSGNKIAGQTNSKSGASGSLQKLGFARFLGQNTYEAGPKVTEDVAVVSKNDNPRV
ncbi:hypothetical protein ACET3Z_012291 [Daucus carota]